MTNSQFSKELTLLEKGLREYALKLTKDRFDASDLYQETAYKATKNLYQFRDNTNLRAWLMTIMRNIFINDYRKKRKRQTLQDGSNNTYLINSGEGSVVNEGAYNLDFEELSMIVDRLENYLKIPFLLAFEGYQYDEIASELDVPLGTIKSRIFLARKKLKKFISYYYRVPNLEGSLAA